MALRKSSKTAPRGNPGVPGGRGGTEAPQAVEAEERELARFFDQSLDLLCIAGLDGRFKHLNPAWERRLGWTLEELQARRFLAFVHPDDQEVTRAEITKLGEGAETVSFENRYRHRDGSYRWLRWNARAELESDLIHAIARDVTRQRELEGEILEIADQEKERLGRELHDGLCQTLSGIAALSASLSRNLKASSDPAASAAAAEITGLLKEAIGGVRDLAHGLGPLDLERFGLEGALEALALSVRHLFRVSCVIECERPFPGLGHEAGVHLFRIAQEAVNNAVTHGAAKGIVISLGEKDGSGLLEIRDDGVGLPETLHHGGGAGMHTMAYRVRAIGGSMEVTRRRPRGTAVTCAFPLPNAPCTVKEMHHASEIE